MTTDIEKHCDAIATIMAAEVAELRTTWSIAPAKLDTAELPAQYTLTSAAQYTETVLGEQFVDVVRVYRVQVPVMPLNLANPEKREQDCRDLLEACVLCLNSHPKIGKVTGVRGARVIGDSGIVVLPEYGAKFVGFEIRYEVTYFKKRIFASNE